MSTHPIATAVIAGAVALVVAAISALVTFWLAQQKADQELRLAEQRLRHEVALSNDRLRQELRIADARLRSELRTEFMAEKAIVRMLQHKTWRRRSFTAIKRALGGFEDDELRQLLVRSGAVRLHVTSDEEYWGLFEGNQAEVGESDDTQPQPGGAHDAHS